MEVDLKTPRPPRSDVRYFWPNYEDFYTRGSKKDLNAQLTGRLVGAARFWINLVDRVLRNEANVSRASWEMLFTIATGERPATMSDVAARHGIQWPTVVRLVNELEKDGLIHTFDNPKDGRSRLVDLTKAGWKKAEQSRFIADALRRSVLAEFTLEEIKTMLDLLTRLDRAILQQEDARKK